MVGTPTNEGGANRTKTATRRQALKLGAAGIAAPAGLAASGSAAADDDYFNGDTLYTSDYGGDPQNAVDDANERDTIVLDTDYVMPAATMFKSDLKVEGGDAVISLEDGATDDVFNTHDCENLWFDGVTIDGNRENQEGAGRGIGGSSIGTISNIRVTNCEIVDCWGNAISFTNEDSGESITDVYLGGNTLKRPGRHGIVCGTTGGSATMSDVIYHANIVEDADRAQHMGYFGHQGSWADSGAILGNTVSKSTGEQKGSGTSLEERVKNSVVFGNTYDDMMGKTGPLVTKNGVNNLVAANTVRRTKHGVGVQDYNYYHPEGPPKDTLVTHNDIAECNNGLRFNNLHDSDGDLVENVGYYNRIRDCDDTLAGDSVSGQKLIENGPDVPASEVGAPDEVGDGVEYETPDGDVAASASWSFGSPHPDDPVQVDVTVNADQF